MDLQKLLGCTSLGSPNRKMWILASRPCIQFESQGVSLQDPRIFQKDLGSLDLSYRKKTWWNRPMDMNVVLIFPVNMGTKPSQHSRHQGTCHWKMTFKQCVILSMQDPRKAFFFQGRKGIHRECVSRPLSCKNHFASKMWVLSCCSECLNSRVKAMCLTALFYPWKQIPSSFRYGSRGYYCGSVSESVGCHAVVTSSGWHSTANWPVARSCEPPACFRNSKGWRRVKLALSQVWKQHSNGFSCSC